MRGRASREIARSDVIGNIAMLLELEFRIPGDNEASAVVVLNEYGNDEKTGLPLVIGPCASMGDLEGELLRLERQIAAIRVAAKQKFQAVATSN
jgi:hypothetical protein